LEGEGGERGDFGREVVVARALAADGGDGEDQVAEFGTVLESAAFAEEEDGLGLDRAEEVHHGGSGGAAHAKINDRDFAGGGAGHRFVLAADGDAVPLGEEVDVAIEISEENVVAELLERDARVARQPVFDDVLA